MRVVLLSTAVFLVAASTLLAEDLTRAEMVQRFDANGNGRLEGAELANFRKFAAAQKRNKGRNQPVDAPVADNQQVEPKPEPRRAAPGNGNLGLGVVGGDGDALGLGINGLPIQQGDFGGNLGVGAVGGMQVFGFGVNNGPGPKIPQPQIPNIGGLQQFNDFARQMQAFGMGQAAQAQQRAFQQQNMRQFNVRGLGVGGGQQGQRCR